ncbi:hypothetical protein [Shewanella xiamenensis]|uniref:hypothetical protein n=1 Tax=Shewanella xiamenensis TaxID=332186 RepID=UPI00217D1C9F|nr:hypothetical protein [Shewanella xiamenensis]MCT8871351.1 hypothetical protein [Shewanella xiamenensis]UWH42865.1 hypothetical protein KXJ80_06290 [Shewanella xiamenensis]
MSKQQCQQMIDAYIAAELDVLAGKQTTINGKTMSTEDLGEIRKGRLEWERRLAAYSRPQGGVKFASFS